MSNYTLIKNVSFYSKYIKTKQNYKYKKFKTFYYSK